MQTPVEFRKACRNLCQGFDEFIQSQDDLARHFLIGADAAAKVVIRRYIDDLLAGPISDEELSQLWNSMPSDALVGNGTEVRRLLEIIRQFLTTGR